MSDILILNTRRTGYGVDQVGRTMTAGELVEFLQQYDEDTKVYLAFDNRYTYGAVSESAFEEEWTEDDEEVYE